MFQRPDRTYITDFTQIKIGELLKDESNPLICIARLIPDGSRVLDVGAGNGLLGWIFSKLHQNTKIDGVEPSTLGSKLAAPYYDRFYNAFYHDVKNDLIQTDYDYIVLADVIEHMSDPYAFLMSIANDMSTKTKMILSVPNVAHGSIRISLLNGKFEYVDSGILEKTHLRFFNRVTLSKMFEKLELNISFWGYLQKTFEMDVLFSQPFKLGFISVFNLLRNREALTYQYLIIASKENAPLVEKEYGSRKISFVKYIILKIKTVLPINRIKSLLKSE